MQRVTHVLRGYTLLETLIMMLVAGILFLSVMEGLMLFSCMQAQRAKALLEAGRQRDGYYRIDRLVSESDSISSADRGLEIFRRGIGVLLRCEDSVLIYQTGMFSDTLLTKVVEIRLVEYDTQPDTVQVHFGSSFIAKFMVRTSQTKQYKTKIRQVEHGYDYEE